MLFNLNQKNKSLSFTRGACISTILLTFNFINGDAYASTESQKDDNNTGDIEIIKGPTNKPQPKNNNAQNNSQNNAQNDSSQSNAQGNLNVNISDKNFDQQLKDKEVENRIDGNNIEIVDHDIDNKSDTIDVAQKIESNDKTLQDNGKRVDNELTNVAKDVASKGPVLSSPTSESEIYLAIDANITNKIRYTAILDDTWTKQNANSACTWVQWRNWWGYFAIKQPTPSQWFGGLNINIYPGNAVCRAMYVKGVYDPNTLVLIDLLLPKDGIFIDIGANMGHYTFYAIKACGAKGKIIAIEPSSRDFARLKETTDMNEFGEVISLVNMAILDEEGEKEMLIADEERSCLNTFGSDFSCKGVQKTNQEMVKVTTLDALLKDKFIQRIDLINLDIEGSELKALQGARRTLEKLRPALILGVNNIAFENSKVTYEQVMEFLKALKYKIYTIKFDNNGAVLVEITDVKDLMKDDLNSVLCLHESILPPVLPAFRKPGFFEKIVNFFKSDGEKK